MFRDAKDFKSTDRPIQHETSNTNRSFHIFGITPLENSTILSEDSFKLPNGNESTKIGTLIVPLKNYSADIESTNPPTFASSSDIPTFPPLNNASSMEKLTSKDHETLIDHSIITTHVSPAPLTTTFPMQPSQNDSESASTSDARDSDQDELEGDNGFEHVTQNVPNPSNDIWSNQSNATSSSIHENYKQTITFHQLIESTTPIETTSIFENVSSEITESLPVPKNVSLVELKTDITTPELMLNKATKDEENESHAIHPTVSESEFAVSTSTEHYIPIGTNFRSLNKDGQMSSLKTAIIVVGSIIACMFAQYFYTHQLFFSSFGGSNYWRSLC